MIILGGPVNASIETEDNLVRVCFSLGEGVWLVGVLSKPAKAAMRTAVASKRSIMAGIALGACLGALKKNSHVANPVGAAGKSCIRVNWSREQMRLCDMAQ